MSFLNKLIEGYTIDQLLEAEYEIPGNAHRIPTGTQGWTNINDTGERRPHVLSDHDELYHLPGRHGAIVFGKVDGNHCVSVASADGHFHTTPCVTMAHAVDMARSIDSDFNKIGAASDDDRIAGMLGKAGIQSEPQSDRVFNSPADVLDKYTRGKGHNGCVGRQCYGDVSQLADWWRKSQMM